MALDVQYRFIEVSFSGTQVDDFYAAEIFSGRFVGYIFLTIVSLASAATTSKGPLVSGSLFALHSAKSREARFGD